MAAALRDEVVEFVRQQDDAVVACLMPALRSAATLPVDSRSGGGLDELAAECAARLRARLADPPRSDDDWSIDLPDRCACDLCGTLGGFVRDRAQRTLEWPLARERRGHIHSRIEAAELPVRRETRRTGRPYTLVLTKTGDLFARERRARDRDEADLEWLDDQWTPRLRELRSLSADGLAEQVRRASRRATLVCPVADSHLFAAGNSCHGGRDGRRTRWLSRCRCCRVACGRCTVNQIMRIFESQAGDRPAHHVLAMSRRQLGMLAGLVAVGTVGAACTEQQVRDFFDQIRNRPVRRDIDSMAPDDQVVQSYEAAVVAMRELDGSDPRNWLRQAAIHAQSCRHANWLFLPWHRAYLLYFERICRELSGDETFALPYWNWTANPQLPAVFRDPGSPLFHASRRSDQDAPVPDTTVGQEAVDTALAPTNFLQFASDPVPLNHPPPSGPGFGPLEVGPHNGVHVFVGGGAQDDGDMFDPVRAARDPIFWLHHARVDELWVQWNLVDENPNTNDSDWINTEFSEFFNADGDPTTASVAQTTLYPLLSYRYDSQGVV